MFKRFFRSGTALAALGVTAFAGAASPTPAAIQCTVINGEKLPAQVGGAPAICSAIRHASEGSTAKGLRVEVRVLGQAKLAATLTNASGKVLAERRFATSDRSLTKSAVDRFARSLMAEVNGGMNRKIP